MVNIQWLKKTKKFNTKITRFFKSYVKCFEKGYHCCVEGVQSHYVVRYLKGRRLFSFKTAQKILTFSISEYNNWEIAYEKKEAIKLAE